MVVPVSCWDTRCNRMLGLLTDASNVEHHYAHHDVSDVVYLLKLYEVHRVQTLRARATEQCSGQRSSVEALLPSMVTLPHKPVQAHFSRLKLRFTHNSRMLRRGRHHAVSPGAVDQHVTLRDAANAGP